MKRLNRKGYLTIEIILGAAIAFVIAFFLIEITTKMVSDTENIYRDTKLTTDIALIISGVKGEIENSGTSIKEIKCEESNSCNISFIDGVNGKLYIKDGKVIYTENDVIQYERELDSSLSSVALTSSVNGKPDDEDNIYFKISGENIYIDKVYDIIIPITTSIGPIGHPPAISCPRKNDSNTKPWTNEPGKGQVDVIVKDEDGEHIFKKGSNQKNASALIFSVSEEYHILLRQATYLDGSLVPVPRNKNYNKKTNITSEYLRHLIENKCRIINPDVVDTPDAGDENIKVK